MSHYAKIKNNQVTNIIVVDRDLIESGDMGDPSTWIEVLDDNGVRIHYVGIGFTYDSDLNKFVPPKPFDSWVFDGTTWSAPIPIPADNKHYKWDEKTMSWIEIPSVLPEIT
jgi:hypothetical protein